MQLNSLDAYTDCPTREQRAWVGDAVVHQQVDLATNEDWGLARNYLELSDSPRPDGILPMVVVGEIEAGGGLTIPDWSLSWVHGVHVQYRHDGDLEAVRRHLPTIERVLRWFAAPRRRPRDDRRRAGVEPRRLVEHLPDRAQLDPDRPVGARARRVRRAERCGRQRRLGGLGARAVRRRRGRLRGLLGRRPGLYVDHIVDGERTAGGVAGRQRRRDRLRPRAAASDGAPSSRRSPIPTRLVVRSWIGSDTGGYDEEKILEQAQGIQRIDWDPEREIVLAEPFFSYAVHDAVAQAGHAELLIDLVRRWDEFLVDGYDTFGECWGWGTPVHGWSSTPTRDLVAYVLGITPDEPGFAPRAGGPAPRAAARAGRRRPDPARPGRGPDLRGRGAHRQPRARAGRAGGRQRGGAAGRAPIA